MKILLFTLVGLASILLVAAAYFYLAYLQPIKGMQPSGKYNVGVISFDFKFESDLTGASRKLNIKAWYPTDATQGQLDLQQTAKTAIAVTKIFNIPSFLASKDLSAAYIDVAIANAESEFPVIIFNHGFASFMTQNTVHMQELASHGYIVLSLAHPGISLITEYTDGSYVAYDENHPAYIAYSGQSTDIEVIGGQIKTILDHAKAAKGFDEYWQVMHEFSDIEIYATLQDVISQWIEDTNQLVNVIANGEAANLSEKIGSFMSPDKIATFGHSLGGVSATFANMSNLNIKASLSLDVPPLYVVSKSELNFDKSTCHIMSDVIMMGGHKLDMRGTNRPLLQKSTAFGCNAIFKDAAHLSFTDMNYAGGMKFFGLLGKADQQKLGAELNHMILWYFDRMLKNGTADYMPLDPTTAELEVFNP